MKPHKRYSLHKGLGYRLSLLASINSRKIEAHLSQLGLTRLMWCVLLAIEEERLTQPSEIAEFIGINRTAASRTLRQMHERKLINRLPGRGDGRSIMVTATEKGRQALDESIPKAQVVAQEIRSKLSREELAVFEELVDKMLAGEIRDLAKL
jgi:DNA-binding MarR family transcriptional regulator